MDDDLDDRRGGAEESDDGSLAIVYLELDHQRWLAEGGLAEMLDPAEPAGLDLSDPTVLTKVAGLLRLECRDGVPETAIDADLRWASLLAASALGAVPAQRLHLAEGAGAEEQLDALTNQQLSLAALDFGGSRISRVDAVLEAAQLLDPIAHGGRGVRHAPSPP